eukprot:925749-Rhodomonas_salina.2
MPSNHRINAHRACQGRGVKLHDSIGHALQAERKQEHPQPCNAECTLEKEKRGGAVRDAESRRRTGLGQHYDSVPEFITSPVLTLHLVCSSWHVARRSRSYRGSLHRGRAGLVPTSPTSVPVIVKRLRKKIWRSATNVSTVSGRRITDVRTGQCKAHA